MRFVGLDLAWSARNRSGGAVIEADGAIGSLVATELLGGDDEIVGFVRRHAETGSALVAVDAPLVVPNAIGRRPAEAELGAIFARYHAGAHPTNRQRVAIDGVVRGEALVARLRGLGFAHRAEVSARQPVRQVVEVFPHPAIVSIFGLERIIRYKRKRGRDRAEVAAELERYRACLRSLAGGEPALIGADEFLAHGVASLRPFQLKDYEDELDALTCAYVAHYLWWWGMSRARVFGNLADGYITTPVPPSLWTSRTPG